MLSDFASALSTVLGYSLSAALRYAVVAGGIYWLLYVCFRRQLAPHHIQESFPDRAELAYQVRWSIATIAVTGIYTILLYQMVERGWSSMYFEVSEYGWPYFLLSILIGIFGYDT